MISQSQKPELDQPQRAAWRQTLVDAETGLRLGIRGDSSLFVFFFAASVVIGISIVTGLSSVEWAIVALTIGVTLSAELFHQLLRQLLELTNHHLPPELTVVTSLGKAGVFVTYLTAAITLGILFGQRLMNVL